MEYKYQTPLLNLSLYCRLSNNYLNHYKDIVDVPNHIIEEIKHFFMVYKNLEHKSTTGFKIDSKIIAEAIIEEALKSYEQNKEKLKNKKH